MLQKKNEAVKGEAVTIFSMKLAGLLMMNQCVIQGIGYNDDGSGKRVFFFNRTPQLEKIIEQYKSKR